MGNYWLDLIEIETNWCDIEFARRVGAMQSSVAQHVELLETPEELAEYCRKLLRNSYTFWINDQFTIQRGDPCYVSTLDMIREHSIADEQGYISSTYRCQPWTCPTCGNPPCKSLEHVVPAPSESGGTPEPFCELAGNFISVKPSSCDKCHCVDAYTSCGGKYVHKLNLNRPEGTWENPTGRT